MDTLGNLIFGKFTNSILVEGTVITFNGNIYEPIISRSQNLNSESYLYCPANFTSLDPYNPYHFFGIIKDGLPNGSGKMTSPSNKPWKFVQNQSSIVYNSIVGFFVDGKPDKDVLVYNSKSVDSMTHIPPSIAAYPKLRVVFDKGELKSIKTSESEHFMIKHFCKSTDFDQHECIIQNKYNGQIDFTGQCKIVNNSIRRLEGIDFNENWIRKEKGL